MHNLVGGTSAKRSVEPTQLGLKPLNVSVWAKNNVGMGSLYRSQNELLPLLKKGTARHVNNIELGKRGRWRSSLDSHACRGLKDDPTAMAAIRRARLLCGILIGRQIIRIEILCDSDIPVSAE